jgi:transcriptional regulator with XRE-family HTH domain
MAAVYLQECTQVKSSLATRRIPGKCALFRDVIARDRKTVRDFLLAAAEHAGTDLSGLARRAGLAPSTLTRFVNGESKYLPTTRTLAKIAEASGYGTPTLGRPDRSQFLEAFQKFAAELGVDLAEAAVLAGADRTRLRRTADWIAMIDRLDAAAERRVFDLVRGMTDPPSASEKQGGPSQTRRGRVSA